MPPSQLKQLKTSLREQGLVGPQKSKKQKKLAAKDPHGRQKRSAALHTIREQFRPFESKAPVRKEKFEVVSARDKRAGQGVQGRPGVTKGLGEERRRGTLLKEIQDRNRVGQIVDRRFGENDPTITPEQRAAERFARQSERQARKKSIFNLEDEDEDNAQLTHMGRSLTFEEGNTREDFKEDGLSLSDQGGEAAESASEGEADIQRPSKRRRLSNDEQPEEDDNTLQLPEKKRSKQEVMKEVMAKAKLFKHERQQAKEDDDDLRAELDKELPDFLQSMREYRKTSPEPVLEGAEMSISINPDRAALLAGRDRHGADQEYNEHVRQMAMDKRSKPSTRTKTDEEKAEEDAARLRDLEESRLRRMEGAPESSDGESERNGEIGPNLEPDDAVAFGLHQPVNGGNHHPPIDVEDEDDFVLDEDLIANDSGAEFATEDGISAEESSQTQDDGDDVFINGLALPPDSAQQRDARSKATSTKSTSHNITSFTYPCPKSHEEFLNIVNDVDVNEIPTIVQRIRARYHPQLNAANKEKLEVFVNVVTQHVAYLADREAHAPFQIIEMLLRHLHSMAKSNPFAVARAFRAHLRDIAHNRPFELRPGDFIILTGLSTIFPTSDHFHSVITPAGLTIARFLGQSPRSTLLHLVKGAYGCTLALQYQSLSRRYIPEVVTYIQQALALLTNIGSSSGESLIKTAIPQQGSSLGLSDNEAEPYPSLHFEDLYGKAPRSAPKATAATSSPGELFAVDDRLKATLISHFLTLLSHAADLWLHRSAFPEIFQPAVHLVDQLLSRHLSTTLLTASQSLHTFLTTKIHTITTTTRQPLILHAHRPVAIKTSIPRYDESYNPERDRHRPRSHPHADPSNPDLQKLKAEHKRERKGAIRELRRDASFIARHQLRDKRERDDAHEKKMRRLVAEIQGEEGHEGKLYEREKERRRKGRR